MEENLDSKPYYPFGKVSATVRRNPDIFMKDCPWEKQIDLAVVPGHQTMNPWSTFNCETDTTLYDYNMDNIHMQKTQGFQPTQKFEITKNNSENDHKKRYLESLPHPSKLRKKHNMRKNTLKCLEKKNGNAEYHLKELKSKQMARMHKSTLSQTLNGPEEFPYLQNQNSECE